jgi:hypothetical protein
MTVKECARNAANARWSKPGKDDATIYGTIAPAANMNLEFNASSQGGGGSSNGSNDATSSSVWNGETIVFDSDFGISVEQVVASATSSPVWDTMLEIA